MTKQPPSGGIPDSIFVFAALLPWQFFSMAFTEASSSLINNANLISKVYFPRMLVPAGAVITSFVDFGVTVGLLGVLMVWYGVFPDWRSLLLIPLTLLTFGLSFGVGLLLAALNVAYRDFRYVVPFIVQFGLFISPVAFSSSSVPANWRLVYSLNPLAGIIDGFRWAILRGSTPLEPVAFYLSIATTMLFLGLGIAYFRRTERGFADII